MMRKQLNRIVIVCTTSLFLEVERWVLFFILFPHFFFACFARFCCCCCHRVSSAHNSFTLCTGLSHSVPTPSDTDYSFLRWVEGFKSQSVRVYLSSLFLFSSLFFRCPEKVPGERITASNAVSGPQGQQLESAIALLKRHATKVDPIQSLMLLPSQTPIFKLKHFLETVAKHTQRERKSGQIFRNLLLSQHLQIQGQRIRIQQSHKIIIEDNDLCRCCHKRIGKTSVSLFDSALSFWLHLDSRHLSFLFSFQSLSPIPQLAPGALFLQRAIQWATFVAQAITEKEEKEM